MSSDKWKSAWGAIKGKWTYMKPKLKTAWAIICDVIIELYKPIEKFANWVHRFASKTPIRIAASAILTCVFLIGICSYFIYPLFFSSTLSFSRFGQISLGVTGLFTLGVVIWRGILHAKQEQHQAEQLRETENNNVAKLLVDGTKLLGDGTSEAEKIAGIACLGNITKGSSSFDIPAADIILGYISRGKKVPYNYVYRFLKYTKKANSSKDLENYQLWALRRANIDNDLNNATIDLAEDTVRAYALHILDDYAKKIKTINNKPEFSIAVIQGENGKPFEFLENIIYLDTDFTDIDFQNYPLCIFMNCNFWSCVISSNQVFLHSNAFMDGNFVSIDKKSFNVSSNSFYTSSKDGSARKFGPMIPKHIKEKIIKQTEDHVF